MLALAAAVAQCATESLRRPDALAQHNTTIDSVSAHIYTSGQHGAPLSQLFPFHAGATVADVFTSKLVQDLLNDRGHASRLTCNLLVAQRQNARCVTAPAAELLVDALSKHAFSTLRCDDSRKEVHEEWSSPCSSISILPAYVHITRSCVQRALI